MPYRCVHCSAIYRDDANEVLEGCGKCKSKFFFYIKEEKLRELEKAKDGETGFEIEFSKSEKSKMEKDVREITGINDEEKPVFLDFESVKVVKRGKYLLDIAKLFEQNKPKVYTLEDGKYIVDLSAPIKKK